MPPTVQVKLLNVLENRVVHRLGSTREVAVDVRVIAATHRQLEEEVAAGRFRQDLYYRLGAFTLKVPPLRERPAEIALLAEMFARRLAELAGAPPPSIGIDAFRALSRYPWPGNVRELRNAVEHAFVLAGSATLEPKHLPEHVRERKGPLPGAPGSIRGQVEDVERRGIQEALSAEGGNRTRTARRLGLSRRALIYKLDKYGLR